MNYTIFAISLLLFFYVEASPTPSFDTFFQEAINAKDFIVEKRRYLHQHPELYFEEVETSEYIQKTLKEIGVNFTANWGNNLINPGEAAPGGTGVVAEIGTGFPPCVALRADIDALALQENNDLPFKSTHDSKMHACGHDAHAAMLLGAAKILKNHEHEIEGTIRLMFQPGEEGGGGGAMMEREGVLTKYPPVQMGFGQHVFNFFKTGEMSSNSGPMTAAAVDFVITVNGQGGHAAMHHETIDPIPAGVAIVRSLYDLYARELYFQTDKAGLISVCFFKTSSKVNNVIPDQVRIGGTIRALKTSVRDFIQKRMKTIVDEISKSYQCTASISQQMIIAYPALENDQTVFDIFNEGIKKINGKGVIPSKPMMGGEDFSFFAEKVPCVFAMIGSGGPNEPSQLMAHQGSFMIDEDVLPYGAAHHAYFAFNALNYLNENAPKKQETPNDEL